MLTLGLENLLISTLSRRRSSVENYDGNTFTHSSRLAQFKTSAGIFKNVQLEEILKPGGNAAIFGTTYQTLILDINKYIPRIIQAANEYCKYMVNHTLISKKVDGKTVKVPDYDLFDNCDNGNFDNSKDFRIVFLCASNSEDTTSLDLEGQKPIKYTGIVQFYTQHDDGRGFDAYFYGDKFVGLCTSP